MKTKKRKILVLSDMKDSTQALMITSVEVAKMLNAEIEFFHVKKPTDIVDRESQLSAVRTINREHIKTDNDIKSMLNTLSEKENLNIDYKYAFGNIKEEIENQIKSSAPDLIVVGKRKSKTLNFIGDNITDFVFKTHKGAVLIASDKNNLQSGSALSLGFLNGANDLFNNDLTKQLINQTESPLSSFKIANKKDEADRSNVNTQNTVEYVFEDNTSTMSTISSYINRNKINLLCVNRGINNHKVATLTKNAINKVNVTLLVT